MKTHENSEKLALIFPRQMKLNNNFRKIDLSNQWEKYGLIWKKLTYIKFYKDL